MSDSDIQIARLTERVQKLEEALEPFSRAYERIRVYDPDAEDLTDDDNLYAASEKDNVSFELFADGENEEKLLKVGHLANALQVMEDND